jgi:hypothetical protein
MTPSPKITVAMEKSSHGREDEVFFHVKHVDGEPLTGQDIVDAVAESVLMYWDNMPLEVRDEKNLN